MIRIRLPALAFLVYAVSAPAQVSNSKLIHYKSCGEIQRLARHPERAISMDINTSEIMLSLGLASRLIAIAGSEDHKSVLPELRKDYERIPKIKASYPGLDALLGKKPDFVFGGWQYGFSEATGLTPQRLQKFGIASYALVESCIRIQSRVRVSLEDVFVDIETIGRIFGQEDKARQLIDSARHRIAAFRKTPLTASGVRVFLYDSGEASPFTAGSFAMPQAMIEAAGATNIFDDVNTSWTAVSWEAVVSRKPDFVIIVDYGDKSTDEKIRFLEKKFRGTNLDFMAKKRYLVLPYAAVTPGVRTVDATIALIQAIAQHYPRAGV